jgi:uncharacterized membrane protein
MRLAALALTLLLLAACGPGDNGGYDTAPPADAPAGVSAEAPSVPAAAPWSGDYDLIGTEPFWNVQIRAAGLTLTRPDKPPLTVANPGPMAEGDSGLWAAPGFVVRLTPGECSDGMSDRKYPLNAEVTIQGQGELRGCASPPRDFSEARP